MQGGARVVLLAKIPVIRTHMLRDMLPSAPNSGFNGSLLQEALGFAPPDANDSPTQTSEHASQSCTVACHSFVQAEFLAGAFKGSACASEVREPRYRELLLAQRRIEWNLDELIAGQTYIGRMCNASSQLTSVQ
eukprot:4005217-Amphidinium_carterae.1